MPQPNDWPTTRDNGKVNRRHEFQQDPETQMCVVCGWAQAVHGESTPLDKRPTCPHCYGRHAGVACPNRT